MKVCIKPGPDAKAEVGRTGVGGWNRSTSGGMGLRGCGGRRSVRSVTGRGKARVVLAAARGAVHNCCVFSPTDLFYRRPPSRVPGVAQGLSRRRERPADVSEQGASEKKRLHGLDSRTTSLHPAAQRSSGMYAHDTLRACAKAAPISLLGGGCRWRSRVKPRWCRRRVERHPPTQDRSPPTNSKKKCAVAWDWKL